MKEFTGLTLESGHKVYEGDLLFTVKSLRNGVVRLKDDGEQYEVAFHDPGNKLAKFDLENCLHLKKVGDIYSNPDGWV